MRRLLSHPLLLRLFEFIDRRSENRVTEFGILASAFEFCKINQIQGDYFEFGVWKGKTFGYARTMATRYDYGPLKYRAFDSFEGLPSIKSTEHEIWYEGQFACSRKDFERILGKKGFTNDEYEITEGFYDQSLTAKLIENMKSEMVIASVIYIDCDLYESTKSVLEFIRHFLQDGTVLCFDDFYNYRGQPDKGEQKAFSEFIDSYPEFYFIPWMPYCPLGMSYICHMKTLETSPISRED